MTQAERSVRSLITGILFLGTLLVALRPSADVRAARFGTAIAAIRVPAEAVIAADSRVVDSNGKRLTDQCKIRVVADTAYAAHKFTSGSGFDLFALVSAAARNSGSLQTLASRVTKSVNSQLPKALEKMRGSDPKGFERTLSGPATGVILARNEFVSPQLAWIRFFVTSDRREQLKVTSEAHFCPGPNCSRGIAAVWVTPDRDKGAFERAHPDYWKGDLVKIAVAFVQGEIARGFPDVGGPIDAVRLVNGKIEWVHREKACQPN